MPTKKMSIDHTADAAYVQTHLHEGYVSCTRAASPCVNVDYDSNANVMGVELIGLKSPLPFAQLVLLGVDDDVIRTLCLIGLVSL